MISCTRAGCQKRIVSVCVADGDDDDDDDDGGNGDDEEEDGARPSLSVCPFFFRFFSFCSFPRLLSPLPRTPTDDRAAPRTRAATQGSSAAPQRTPPYVCCCSARATLFSSFFPGFGPVITLSF